ncbi:MAG: lipopolysaccharide assembly protein LapA domain-containing protein [Gaiellaceae bacterium]
MRLIPRLRRRSNGRPLEEWQPRLWAIVIGLALLGAYAIAFVIENHKRVGVHFVLATAHVSLIWLILLSFGIGLLGGLMLSQLYRRRSRKQRGKTGDARVDLPG